MIHKRFLESARALTWPFRASRIRSIALVIAAFALFTLYELAPLIDPASVQGEEAAVRSSAAFEEFSNEIMRRASQEGEAEAAYQKDINLLTKLYLQTKAYKIIGPDKAEPTEIHISTTRTVGFRVDNFVVMGGLLAIFVAATMTTTQAPTRSGVISPTAPSTQQSFRQGEERYEDLWSLASSVSNASEIFQTEVIAANRRTDAIFQRSTFLLLGGVVMAFIGVVVFYLSLPDSGHGNVAAVAQSAALKKNDVWAYLQTTVRPTAVLIFLEAIAWFLLRQYRSLIEDYKWFYRVYVKRVNYLAATRLLDDVKVSKEKFFLATSLMREEMSERLKVGETTEAIEKLKIPEEGPLRELASAVETVYQSVRRQHANQGSPKNKSDPKRAKGDDRI